MECNKKNLTEYLAKKLAEIVLYNSNNNYSYSKVGLIYNIANDFGIHDSILLKEFHNQIEEINKSPRIVVTKEMLEKCGIPKFENLDKY